MTDDLIGPPTLGDLEIADDRIGRHAPRARMDDWWTALRDASSNEGSTLSPLRSGWEREEAAITSSLTPSPFSWMNQRLCIL